MVFCITKEKADVDKWIIRSVGLPNFQKGGGEGGRRGERVLDRVSLFRGELLGKRR